MRSDLFLNWLPITFSSPVAGFLHLEGDEKKEGHALKRNVDTGDGLNGLSGLFLLDDSFQSADHKPVNISQKSFKNAGLINQAIKTTLKKHFTLGANKCAVDFQSVSVIITSTEKKLLPEFSIFDSFQLTPHYIVDSRDGQIVFGVTIDYKVHYQLLVADSDIKMYKNRKVTDGKFTGILKEINSDIAMVEVRNHVDKFTYDTAIIGLPVVNVQPIGSIPNINQLIAKKYPNEFDRIDFERRRASLSITSNASVNQNILRDKLAKINAFVSSNIERANKFSLYSAPDIFTFKISSKYVAVSQGSDNQLSIRGRRLDRRIFSFNLADTQETVQSLGQYQGIQKCGPLERIKSKEQVRYLFIYEENRRDVANKLFFALKNGVGSFPGIESLFRMPIANENVIGIKVSTAPNTDIHIRYVNAINEYINQNHDIMANCKLLAFVLSPEMQQGLHPNPYHASKALLLSKGIPSQGIDYETILGQTFRWSMSNVALAVFAKLGGIPWRMWNRSESKQLIFGIGQKLSFDEQSNSVKRIIGFTVCVTPDGRFQSVTTFKPFNSNEEFVANLKDELVFAIQNAIKDQGDVDELIVHFPKPSSNDEIYEIEKALDIISKSSNKLIPYAILRVAPSKDMYLFDTAHETHLPEEGNIARLSPSEALLCVPGRQEKKSIHAVPKYPLRVKLERSTLTSTKFDQLLYQVYSLAGANWRGFNAREMPITLFYSRLIAELISDLEHYEYDFMSGISNLERIPWFL